MCQPTASYTTRCNTTVHMLVKFVVVFVTCEDRVFLDLSFSIAVAQTRADCIFSARLISVSFGVESGDSGAADASAREAHALRSAGLLVFICA